MKKQRGNNRPPKFNPLSEEQLRAYESCLENDIVFLTGAAGSSKTFTAIAAAVDLAKSKEMKIIISRPAIEACGEQIGFLPGTSSEKMKPFLHPVYDTVNEYAGEDHGILMDIVPLAYMRGRTFKNSVVVLDEAQNATLEQLKLLLTRIGKGSKIFVCGDWSQSDIRKSALKTVSAILDSVEGIKHFHFSNTASIARHRLIPAILDAFEKCGE